MALPTILGVRKLAWAIPLPYQTALSGNLAMVIGTASIPVPLLSSRMTTLCKPLHPLRAMHEFGDSDHVGCQQALDEITCFSSQNGPFSTIFGDLEGPKWLKTE